jgi:hypothetical protein
MGVEFITKKNKKFTHRRDKKFAENIQSANLMSGAPEKVVQQFRCKAEGDTAAEVGMRVLLYREGAKINVLYLNKKIGVVMSPDAASLKKLMGEAEVDLSSASVVDVRPTAKIFVIQLL